MLHEDLAWAVYRMGLTLVLVALVFALCRMA
jgi:hypothetical protein